MKTEQAYADVVKFTTGESVLVLRPGTGRACEILDVEANPRGEGIGRRLVGRAEEWARGCGMTSVFAFCRQSNRIACEFYAALGFRGIPAPGFYRDDPAQADAVLFVKPL